MQKGEGIGLCLGVACVGVAAAQCPFVVDDFGTADALTVTCTPTGVANEYDLLIEVTDDDAVILNILVLLDGGVRPSIRTLEIEGDCVSGCMGGGGVPQIGVTVLGPSGSEDRLAGLGEFKPALTNNAEITIDELRVGGDVGTIRAHSIVLAEIDGNVTGSIILNTLPVLVFDLHSVGLIDIAGNLEGDFLAYGTFVNEVLVGGRVGTSGQGTVVELVQTSNLFRLDCQSMESDVSVSGLLGRLAVTEDLDGSVSAFAIGGAGVFSIPGDDGLFVGGDISGSIEIGPFIPGPGAWLPAIEAADLQIGGSIGGDVLLRGAVAGDASVSLASLSASNRLQVGDEIPGFISEGVSGALTIGSVAPAAAVEILGDIKSSGSLDIVGAMDGTIVVHGSLLGSLSTDATQSLVGQVIVNAEGVDPGDPTPNVWSGPVTIGATPNDITLAPTPHYSNLSADIGGGAVGLVPYTLHGTDCTPANNATVSAPPSSPLQSVTLRHYGPLAPSITLGTLLGMVERKPLFCAFGQPCDWEDVSEAFVASLSQTNERDMIVSGDFDCGYRYRITPGNGVVCAGTVDLWNLQIPVSAYTYTIRVFCSTDLTMNGLTETPDLDAWIASPADVDQDGTVGLLDLEAIVGAIE